KKSRLIRSLRATFLGLAVNTVLAAAKFVAGILGHSHALVADAVESLADIFSSIVVWRGLVVAAAPADEDHPYGHGKAEPIAAAPVIAWNGWRLPRPALNELMDTLPSREIVESIRKLSEAVPGVARVEKCLVRKMGHQYYVDMHVEVDPQMTVQRSHEIAHDVKDRIRSRIPRVRDVLVHIEPSRMTKPE